MIRPVITLTWILFSGYLADRPMSDASSADLWESYFELIRSNPTSAMSSLEDPVSEARRRAIQDKREDEILEYSVLLMLVYNNQGKFGNTFALYRQMRDDDPSIMTGDSFFHKAFKYLGYHSDSRQNRKQDLTYLGTIAGTFGEESLMQKLFQALSLDLLGRTQYDHNRYDEAFANLSEANRIIAGEGLRGLLGSNYTMLGVVTDAQEDYRQAIAYYEASNEVFESLDEQPYGSIAINAYNIGLIYLDRFGEGLRSLPHFEKALEFDRLDGGEQSPYLADDYSMLSTVYLKLHDYDRARQYIQRAIEHYYAFSYPENPSLGTAYLNLATIASRSKNYADALGYVDKAIGIYEENKIKYRYDIRRWLAVAFNTRGKIALLMGDYDLASSAFKETEAIAMDLDRTIYLLDAYRGLIEAYLMGKRPNDAYQILQKLSTIIDEKYADARRFAYERRVLSEEIEHLQSNGRKTPSLDRLIDDLASENGMSDLLVRSLRVKTKAMTAYPADFDDSEPIIHLQNFLNVVVGEYNGRSGLINRSEFNVLMKPAIVEAVALSHEMYSRDQNPAYLDMAFQFMDVNKSASLMEGLSSYKEQFGTDVPMELRAKERTLEANRNSILVKINNLIRQSGTDQNLLLEAYSTYDSVSSQLDSLESAIKQSYPTYYSLSQLDASARLSDLVDTLDPDQTLIGYIAGSHQAYALVVTRDSQKLHLLTGFQEIEQKLLQFRETMTGRGSLDLATIASRILPMEAGRVTNLIVVPDGVLSGFPFEILPVGDSMLLEKTSVSYRFGFRTPYVTSSRGWNWQGFAPSYALRPLPHNRSEIEAISKITGGQVFAASEATKESFLQEAPGATIIHLAAHGELNNGNPIFSSILFGDDPSQELTAMEIYGLRLRGSLAVLSACATGLSDDGNGDGWMSLSRAFAFAGVQSTLMSLWEVPDRETAVIMESFYTHLQAGLPKDVALQRAKLEYLAQTSDPALRHPYYWAGFVLSGDTDGYSSRVPAWVWVLLVAAIMGATGLIRYWLRPQTTRSS